MRKKSIHSKIKIKAELVGSLLGRLKKNAYSETLEYGINYSIPILHNFDIAVIGGGISGITAALVASRNGAKTVLVEQQGALGGLATLGLIPPISNQFFDGKGRQVIKGIADEIMTRLARAGGTVTDWRDWKIPKYPFDIEIFKLIVYELLQEAGVDIMLNTFFSEAVMDDDKGIKYVVVENKSGRKALKAKIFVDCTGDASLAISSGAPCNIYSDLSDLNSARGTVNALLKKIGWTERTEKTASLQFTMGGVDFDRFYSYAISNPESFDTYYRGELKEDIELFKYLWGKGIFYLPHTRHFEKEIKKALSDKFFKAYSWRYRSIGECGVSLDGLKSNGILTVTANKIRIDPFFDEDITKALIKGQEICFEIWRFFKKYIPGIEKSVLIAVAPLLGIRRAAQIKGKRILTVEEREEEREYEDVIGLYSRKTLNAREIPYFCMVPLGVSNLIIGSGKSVSTDDFFMYRTKPHCMVIGQAAGTAAAICAKNGLSPQGLDIKLLQRILYHQGVYLGDRHRLLTLGLI